MKIKKLKFLQLVAGNGSLYGLDDKGRIWTRYYGTDDKGWGLMDMCIRKEDLINV